MQRALFPSPFLFPTLPSTDIPPAFLHDLCSVLEQKLMAGCLFLSASGGDVVLTGLKRASISRYMELCWVLAGAEVGTPFCWVLFHCFHGMKESRGIIL